MVTAIANATSTHVAVMPCHLNAVIPDRVTGQYHSACIRTPQRRCEEGNCVDQQHENAEKKSIHDRWSVRGAKYSAWNLLAMSNTQSPVPLLNLSLQPIYNGAIAATGFQGDLLILLHVSWFSQTEIYNAILWPWHITKLVNSVWNNQKWQTTCPNHYTISVTLCLL